MAVFHHKGFTCYSVFGVTNVFQAVYLRPNLSYHLFQKNLLLLPCVFRFPNSQKITWNVGYPHGRSGGGLMQPSELVMYDIFPESISCKQL